MPAQLKTPAKKRPGEALVSAVPVSSPETARVSVREPRLVTVAVPTVRRPALLQEALRSLRRQDYPNLEILVSDNGSHDQTPELVRHLGLGDRRIRLRCNDETVSIPEHFNQCLAEAQGEYFCLLCDDDRVNPGFVSGLVELLERHPSATVAIPRNLVLDEHGSIHSQLPLPEHEALDGVQFILDWFANVRPPAIASAVTLMAHTQRLRDIGGYRAFPSGLNADNLILILMALQGQVTFCPRSVFYYRVYSSSVGLSASGRKVARASRELCQFLRFDPLARSLLRRQPRSVREQIIRGAQEMTAREFLIRIGFFKAAWAPGTIARLCFFTPNQTFLRLVGRHYWSGCKRLLPSSPRRPASNRNTSNSTDHV